MAKICRFCLKSAHSEDQFQEIETLLKDLLDALLLNLDFNVSKQSVICKECLNRIYEMFDFKTICIYTEDALHPFFKEYGQVKLNLLSLYSKAELPSPLLNSKEVQICRLCLEITKDCIPLGTKMLQQEFQNVLNNHLPEILLDATNDPQICKNCRKQLYRFQEFVSFCTNTEEKVMKIFKEEIASGQLVESYSELHLMIKDELDFKRSNTLSMENFTTTTNVGTLLPLFFNSTVPPDAGDGSIFFVWYDYVIFSCLLCMSWGMGIYFGCFGKKQTTTDDYLLGGKQMHVLPVAISLTASHSSGVTLLAVPSEVYKFGASYWLVVGSILLVAVITNYIFLPVFYKLQLTSTYEYLGLRFDKKTRKLASFLFAISVFSLMPVVIYIPSLAFSAATGLDVHLITPVICGICIFYTTIGGLKALIWTDTIQFTLTVGAILAIMTLGFKDSGGVLKAFQKAIEGQRLDIFRFNLDLTDRDSFWAMLVGFTFHWVAHTSINQGCTQKFLSVATMKECKRLVLMYCFFMIIMKSTSVINGLLIYNKFADCDPLRSGAIKNNDQILPYYVLNVAGSIPGLSGLFIAGVFFASLSSFSGNLNSLAGTIYEDFLKNTLERKNIKNTTCVLKILVLIIGIITVLMVYIVERLGGLMAISIALGSVAHGPLLGMFILGVLFPRVRAKGAFYGGVSGMLVMATIVFGNCYFKSKKMLAYPSKPISLEGCSVNGTSHNIWNATVSSSSNEVPQVFRISFYWYSLMGGCMCMIIGLVISYLMEKEEEPYVARELLSPAIYSIIDPKKYQDKMDLDYTSVDEALIKEARNGSQERRKSSKWEMAREERLRMMSISAMSDVIDD